MSRTTPDMTTTYYLHGVAGSAALWKDVEAGAGGIAIDLAGHGARRHEPALATVDAIADDVATQLTPYGDIRVVGHSLGGAVAQMLVARGVVQSAVLVCTARRFPAASTMLALLREDEFAFRELFARALDGGAVTQALLDSTPAAVLEADLTAAASFEGRTLTIPRGLITAVVGARRDQVVPLEVVKKASITFGCAFIDADSAHMVPETSPQSIIDALALTR